MKITIDTKEDSRHELRKVAEMINSILEADAASSGASGSPQPVVGEGIFGMFSSNSEETAPSQPAAGNELAGFFSETREEKVDVSEPKVVEGIKKEDDEYRIVPY